MTSAFKTYVKRAIKDRFIVIQEKDGIIYISDSIFAAAIPKEVWVKEITSSLLIPLPGEGETITLSSDPKITKNFDVHKFLSDFKRTADLIEVIKTNFFYKEKPNTFNVFSANGEARVFDEVFINFLRGDNCTFFAAKGKHSPMLAHDHLNVEWIFLPIRLETRTNQQTLDAIFEIAKIFGGKEK